MNSRLFFSSSSLPRVKIDPLLTTFGDASSDMSFLLTFNGIDLFTATATLNHGLLTTSGAFSLGEFDTVTTSTGVTATLKRIDFSVPFSIGMGDVNKDLPFEFDQTFRANAANGGSAFAGVPQSATTVPLAVVPRRRSLCVAGVTGRSECASHLADRR